MGVVVLSVSVGELNKKTVDVEVPNRNLLEVDGVGSVGIGETG